MANGIELPEDREAAANFQAAGLADPVLPKGITSWDKAETSRRLGNATNLIGDLVFLQNGRGLAKFLAFGPAVRPILAGHLGITGDVDYTYKLDEEEVDWNCGISPDVRNITFVRLAMDEMELDTKGPRRSLSRISSVTFGETSVAVGRVIVGEWQDGEVLESGAFVMPWNIRSGDTDIAHVRLEYSPDAPEHIPGIHVDHEIFIGSAVQAALLMRQQRLGLSGMGSEVPHIEEIEDIEIVNPVEIGENVEIRVYADPDQPGFAVSAEVIKEDCSTAYFINGVKGYFREREKVY